MNKYICTTTINPATKALKKYAQKEGWNLIVAGDIKTPQNSYFDLDLIYLTPEYQKRKYPVLSDLIGWNTIERRNFAILEALERDADLIALVDDDNIPYPCWGEDIKIGKEVETIEYTSSMLPVFDPIFVTDYPKLWHRGFPIELLPTRKYNYKLKTIIPDIQASFWNGQPDIDAVCRMNNPNLDTDFCLRYFPFTTNLMSPFNSQNTIISKVVAKDGYFLFPFIGRMSDIWIAYYITAKGYRVVYNGPTVYQERNPHSLVEDLKQEMLGYEKTLELIYALQDNPENIHKFLPLESIKAFDEYKNIVEKI